MAIAITHQGGSESNKCQQENDKQYHQEPEPVSRYKELDASPYRYCGDVCSAIDVGGSLNVESTAVLDQNQIAFQPAHVLVVYTVTQEQFVVDHHSSGAHHRLFVA